MQSSNRLHISSLLQLLMSGAGLALAAVAVLSCTAVGFYLSRGNSDVVSTQAGAAFALAWVSGVLGLAALPSLYQAGLRLLNPTRLQQSAPGRLRLASFVMLVWPLVLASGYAVQKADGPVWLFLPLHTLATILPLWWLVEFCARGLSGGTTQRRWGALNFGLFVSNPLALMVELIGGFGGLIAIGIFLASRPEIAQRLEDFRSQIFALQNDPAAMQELFAPFLGDPGILLLILVVAAGLVPLVEELIKPLAVWALAGRKITPSEGFVLGAIAGAAFALQETLLVAANSGSDTWLMVIIGRTGTGVLHVSTTALMGRAIAEALNDRGALRLVGSYLLVVVMHGLWNTMSILSGFGGFFTGTGLLAQIIGLLGQASPVFLVLLVGIFLSLLWYTNRKLSQTAVVESG